MTLQDFRSIAERI